MKKKMAFLISVIVIIVLGATGCATKEATKSTAADQIYTIKVPTQTSFNSFMIAEDLGYFKEEGVEIKYTGVLKPGQNFASLMSGDNDVVSSHPDALARAILAGAKVKAITPGMVDDPKYPHLIYYVKEGSPLKSATDVIGKKVGVTSTGSCSDGILLDWLVQNNIPLDTIEFVIMPDTQQEQTLKQGIIDIATWHPAYYQKAENTGGVTRLIPSWDIVKSPNGGTNFDAVASEKWLQANPEAARRFSKALIRSYKFINENPQGAIEILAKRLNMKPEDLNGRHWDEKEYILDERIQPWLDRMTKLGWLQPGQQIKPADIYTNDYNPYYKKES